MENTISRRIESIASHLENIETDVVLNIQSCSASRNDAGGEILQTEKKGASFDPTFLIDLHNGGPEGTHNLKVAARCIELDDVLRDKTSACDISRSEHRERTMAKIKRVIEMHREGFFAKNPQMEHYFIQLMDVYDPSYSMRFGVHRALFAPTVLNQGSAEQVEKYRKDIDDCHILGCFAMTELGNGSFIQNFETTSTYDVNSQEFVINSPTITSTKWWIGMAAETATHSVVFARLIIGTTDHGIHIFIVPLRSVVTGEVLLGVELGDVGAKMGRNGLDNGWIRFHQVRVPRENLLTRYCSVSPSGEYTPPPLPQLTYGSLLGGRVVLSHSSINMMKKAITIAIRYNCVRVHHKSEQVIDYATQQYRLLPILAETWAIHFATVKLAKTYTSVQKDLSTFDTSNLADFHALSSGVKAFVTWFVQRSLETCRECCGGHGYSSYVGIAGVLADFVLLVSGEGDNTVISYTQCARYLVNSWGKVLKGGQVNNSISYFNNTKPTTKNSIISIRDLHHPETQLQVAQLIAVLYINKSLMKMQALKEQGFSSKQVMNQCSVDLIDCAKAHTYHYFLLAFIENVASIHDHHTKSALKTLCDLFFFQYVQQQAVILLENSVLGKVTSDNIRDEVLRLCKDVRPNVIALVEGFSLPDFVLDSPFAASDGNIYHHYMEATKRAPQNPKPAYWNALIKPLLDK